MPWAPKKPTFTGLSTANSASVKQKANAQQSVPDLLPILPIGVPSTSSGIIRRSNDDGRLNEDEQAELLRAQININTQIMGQVEHLRKEREQFMKQLEQAAKEKQVLKVKLTLMNEQIQNLMKKANKNQSGKDEDAGPSKGKANDDENADPNQGKAADGTNSQSN